MAHDLSVYWDLRRANQLEKYSTNSIMLGKLFSVRYTATGLFGNPSTPDCNYKKSVSVPARLS